MRRRLVLATALAAFGAVGAARASGPTDYGQPPPALPATARLAVTSGAGSQRVSVWVATNAHHEVCAGWRTGPSTGRPTSFTCLRRGLEQPLVEFESGGGSGGIATWGVLAGVVGPSVGRLDAETLFGARTVSTLVLRPVPSLPGWRAFATQVLEHPTSTTLQVYDRSGAVIVQGSSALIHPVGPPAGPITITPPGQPPTGPAWSDAETNLIPRTASARLAIGLALADPAVLSILAAHPAWLEGVSTWGNCSGRRLGGVVGLRFVTPATFVATLPSVQPPSGPSSYAVVVQRIAAAGWNSLAVWVDTSAASVAGIDWRTGTSFPGASGDSVSVLETVSPPHDAGGPDTPGCWKSHD